MVARAIAAGVPFRWVAADSVYGVGALEMALRRAGKGYVLGVNANSAFHSWGKAPSVHGCTEDIAAEVGEADWRRLSAGEGTKRPRLHDWAYFAFADLDGAGFGAAPASPWTRGLLILRNIADGALAYSTTWCPHGTSIETLVEVKGIAGRSKTTSRRARTSSASTTMKCGPGTTGIVMFRSACWRSP